MSRDLHSNPASLASAPRRPLSWHGLLVVYVAALASIIGLYFWGERIHFQDGITNLRMFQLAFPQLACVALVPVILGAIFRPRKLLSQVCFGAALGLPSALIAFVIYNNV